MSQKGKKRKKQWKLWDEQALHIACATRRKEIRYANKHGPKKNDSKFERFVPIWDGSGNPL